MLVFIDIYTAVIKQSLPIVHLFSFLLSNKFAAPLLVPACTVLVCGGAGSNQSKLLRIRNFRGLRAGTADGPLDVIFSVRGVVCSSKGYMSRPCRSLPA